MKAHGPAGEVMRLRRLDLNLLVALDCLLVERGVTKAARRLGVSQSTASDALARLRRHFNDPLLQGKPRAYELSPLAQRLRPAVADAVTAADRVFAGMPGFEPMEEGAEFRVLGSEHALVFAGAALSRAVSAQSRRSRLLLGSFVPADDPSEQLRKSDGLLLSDKPAPGDAERIDLGEDRIMVVRAAGSTPVETVSDLGRRPWVVHTESAHASASSGRFANASIRLRVEVEVPSALSVPFYVEDTDRLALLPLSLAEQLARGSRVEIAEPPLELEPVRVALWWHPARAVDPAHLWLRNVADGIAAR